MIDKNNLPKGWEWKKLGEVCDCLDNKRKPISKVERNNRILGKNDEELFPYYGATGQTGVIDDYLFDGEYLLIGEDGCPFLDEDKDKSYIINGKSWVNNHAHILKTKGEIESHLYLKHYLDKYNYNGIVSGSTRLKLNKSALLNIDIIYPVDKGEQKVIVDALKEVSEAIRLRKETIELSKELITSIFHDMFGDPITNPKEWEKDYLDNLCVKITDGSHNPPKPVGYNTEHLMLSSQNIKNNELVLNNVRYLTEEGFRKENKRTDVQDGDILLTIVGTIGRSLIVTSQMPRFVLQRSVSVIKTKQDKVNNIFLNYMFQTDAFNILFNSLGKGVAQKGMYLKDLRGINLITPPLLLQEEFAKKAMEIEEYIKAQKTELANFEELFQSLLQEAFNGNLTAKMRTNN